MNSDDNGFSGVKLWKRAKAVIPGGGMLLSKRPEMFAPEQWPTYFRSARGISVRDLDGNTYSDFSLMGVGTNTLGYGNRQVDSAVRRAVKNGNMSTLNNPKEVILAEKLVELHPWADQVKFARSGGEANSIAIRIARAATGRDAVAVCGYHGWHDWYLSVNLRDENGLDDLLLPGLLPLGVPAGLAGTTLPFHYGNFEELLKISATHSLAAIKLEVARGSKPDEIFLRELRALATKVGAVLIFDECTSGFRETYGGIHLSTQIEPDMAMFGKALGNGYAVTAVIGRRSVMENAQRTFISSTFWTEGIGSAAGVATLGEMERLRSWEIISAKGREIKQGWREIAKSRKVPIEITGLDALASFFFTEADHQIMRTYFTQEMLQRGYLASPSVYLSTAHTDSEISRYLENFDQVFAQLEGLDNDQVKAALHGPVAHAGFQRLN